MPQRQWRADWRCLAGLSRRRCIPSGTPGAASCSAGRCVGSQAPRLSSRTKIRRGSSLVSAPFLAQLEEFLLQPDLQRPVRWTAGHLSCVLSGSPASVPHSSLQSEQLCQQLQRVTQVFEAGSAQESPKAAPPILQVHHHCFWQGKLQTDLPGLRSRIPIHVLPNSHGVATS